jgi:hypothetical protein
MKQRHLWVLAALLGVAPVGAAGQQKPTALVGVLTPAPAGTPFVAPTLPSAKVYEPTGYENAKWGMSLGEVWKMYPKARLIGEEEQTGAPVVEGPYVDRLMLTEQKVPGFEQPTNVELRFWKGKFWATIIFFGPNDPEKSKAYILKQFGQFTAGDDFSPMWVGEKVTTGAAYHQGWYGSSYNPLSEGARTWFTDMMNGRWTKETEEEKAEREARMAALTPQAAGGTKPPDATPSPAPAK